jgi:hypothetical protein
MPGLPSSRWRGSERGLPLLDTVIAGHPLPADAPRQIRLLAVSLAQLARPDRPGELAGEVAAVSAFRRAVPLASTLPLAPLRRHRRRKPRLMAGRARLAGAIAIAAIAVGGSAAAYAGVLPASVQNLAHRLIDAPPAFHHAAQPAAGTQPSGLHRGDASSRSAANSKHQRVSHGVAKGHGKPTPRPHRTDKGKARKYGHRKRAHRAHRHATGNRPGPAPTPTPIG